MHRAVDSEEGSTSNLAGPIRGEIPGRHGRLGGGEGVSRGSSGRGGRWKTGVEQERGRRERGKVKMDGRMEEVMNN